MRVDGRLIVTCATWLLYPGLREILPDASNILHFMSDFTLLSHEEPAEFKDGWRIFGRAWGGPARALPEDTGLRRAVKARLLAGGRMGRGYGILLLNERISDGGERA